MSAFEKPEFTYKDFQQGRVERLMQSGEYPRILAVWPHGDEPIGPLVGHHLYNYDPELLNNVDYLCGNPIAAAQVPQVRYTKGGSDLNRSFSPDFTGVTYERERAGEILELIKNNKYDFIIDLHTSKTQADRALIIDDASLATRGVRKIIEASPIKNIISFPSWIAEEGLIGQVENAVSVEYELGLAETLGIQETVSTIHALVNGKPSDYKPIERYVYHVDGVIKKDEEPEEGSADYKLCGKGYYPILFGGPTYKKDPSKNYSGFRALKRTVELI